MKMPSHTLHDLGQGCMYYLLMLPLMALPLVFLRAFKGWIIVLALLIKRDLRILSPYDVIQCPGENGTKAVVNIGFSCKIQGKIKIHDLRKKFCEKFLKIRDFNPEYEKFWYSLEEFGGHMFAKREHTIDIPELIHTYNLEDDETLEEYFTDWVVEKYPRNSPCWEMVMIPLEASNETVVGFKIHQAFADGYSLLYILDQLTENKSPYLVKEDKDSFFQKVIETLDAPVNLTKFRAERHSLIPSEIGDEPEYEWMMAFSRMDLQVLKKIRREHNVKFGSLMISLVAGALRRYLLETYKTSELNSTISLQTTLPLPNHPSKNPKSKPRDRMCNHWATAVVRVPLREEDPIKRLLAADESLSDYTSWGLHKFINRFMVLIWALTPVNIVRGIFKMDEGFAGGYSSIVGGNNYNLLGKPVTQIHPIFSILEMNPCIPLSLFTFSHSNHLELTLGGDPKYFPEEADLHRILYNYLPKELEILGKLSNVMVGK